MIEMESPPADLAADLPAAGPVTTDSLGGRPLVYSNERLDGFHYTPAEFEVRVTGPALRRVYGLARRLRLTAPSGWAVADPERFVLDPTRALCWKVRPSGEPPSCLVNLVLAIGRPDDGVTEIVHAVPVEIRGRTQFEPRRHALPFANAAAEFGEVEPSEAIFAQTYRSSLMARRFFRGLYGDVVYLTGDASRARPGGLCTGIARSTLEFSLSQPAGRVVEQEGEALREAAKVWHGKQLADRALLASTAEWVRHGSRDAYLAFRRAVLARGRAEVAMEDARSRQRHENRLDCALARRNQTHRCCELRPGQQHRPRAYDSRTRGRCGSHEYSRPKSACDVGGSRRSRAAVRILRAQLA
jgi:hypothetical protein